MHGRLKVKTNAQKEAERAKEDKEKAIKYKTARTTLFNLTGRQCSKTVPCFGDEEASPLDILPLATTLLIFNCECNTFWNIRKEYVQERLKQNLPPLDGLDSQKFFQQELAFTVQCLTKNPKAYAVWLYREFIMLADKENSNWEQELTLCDGFLKLDGRNFHCWDYRRVVLQHNPQITKEKELTFTRKKIEENFSNFSSWHYRTKLLCGNHDNQVIDYELLGEDSVRHEIDLVYNALFTDPTDQSAWYYYRWLHSGHSRTSNDQTCISTICALRVYSCISIVFSHYISQKELENSVEIFLCSSPVRFTVQSVNGYQTSSKHWLFSIVSSSFGAFGKVDIRMTFARNPIHPPEANCVLKNERELNLHIEEQQKCLYVVNYQLDGDEKQVKMLSSEGFEHVYPSLYKYDVDLMMSLSSEEPNNKYVLLELLNFYRRQLVEDCDEKSSGKKETGSEVRNETMEPCKSLNKCLEVLDKLKEIDGLRCEFYNDTRSDIIIESKSGKFHYQSNNKKEETLDEKQLTLDLSHMSLSRINGIANLCMLTKINLSNNNLKVVDPLKGFLNLKVLQVDHNKIEDLSALSMSYSLVHLSISHNLIGDRSEFNHLNSSPSLKYLNVSHNPVLILSSEQNKPHSGDAVQFSEFIMNLFPYMESLIAD